MMVIVSEIHKTLLDNIYFDTQGRQGSFSGLNSLYREAKKLDRTISKNIVELYLRGNESYTAHKRVIRKIRPRRSLLVLYPHEIWSCDLIFYINERSVENLGATYCLNVHDVFTHYSYSRHMKSKTAKETLQKFKDVVREAKVLPRYVFVDEGKACCIKKVYP